MKIKNIKHKWIRILLRIIMVLGILVLSIALITVCFLCLWKPLGAAASKEKQKQYESRAANFHDGKFENSGQFMLMSNGEFTDVYKDREGSKGHIPADTLPVEKPEINASPERDDVTVTWLGHSTIFMQINGLNILFDPVLSDIASPVSFTGSKRFSALPITAEELPEIDVVIITHDHYDHLDYPTIKKIKDKTKKFIVPLGIENHLIRFGVDAEKILNMAWWEEMEIDGLNIACTPAKHYSGRSLNDRYASLWASWVLQTDSIKIFESGDTGYGSHFSEIHDKYGDFDFAMLDCAQYNERWHEVHMFPEESVQAAEELNAKVSMPIHWGAFSLAPHPWDDPAQRFVTEADSRNLTSITLKLGQTVKFPDIESVLDNDWWKDYK